MVKSKTIITDKVRGEIEARLIALWKKRQSERKNRLSHEGLSIDVKQIAEEMNCKQSAVYKILRELKNKYRWHSCSRLGRPRKLTAVGIQKIKQALCKGPNHYRPSNLKSRIHERWTIESVKELIYKITEVKYSLGYTHQLYKNEFKDAIPKNFRVKRDDVH